ncbi:apolipoprotein N-acyltransferase [bacterium]|nr:apolipoprotein N-acyltransferase [bacterium]
MFLRKWGLWISAGLGILAFPPISLWPLAWISLVPFLIVATDLSVPRIFGKAWRAGVLFFGGVLYWVGLNSGAPWLMSAIAALAMIMILATIWGTVAWAVQKTARIHGTTSAAWLFASLYVALEIFWGTGEVSLPWALWGLTQSSFLPAAQFAEIIDVEGISAWVLSVNVLLFLYFQNRRRVHLIAAALLYLVPIAWGAFRMNQVDGGVMVQCAAVQANIPAETKWQMSSADILQDHVRWSDSLKTAKPALIVWPETAAPMPVRLRPWAVDTLQSLSRRTGAIILTGATDYEMRDGEQRPLNAALAIRPDSFGIQRSAKIHLVPFGERIPLQKTFPALRNLHLGQAEFLPGDSVVVFSGGEVPPFTCLICFEVIYPEIAADAVKKGAQLFGHITNDGWYGNSSGPYQHLELSRLRAIATRRSIVRSANTGVSALILPSGRFLEKIAYDKAGVISSEVPARADVTIAVRLARAWPAIYYGILATLLAALWMKWRRYGHAESS